MPALRTREGATSGRIPGRGLGLSSLGGVLGGACAVAILRGFGLENLPGSLRRSSGQHGLCHHHLGVGRWAALFGLLHAAGAFHSPMPVLLSVLALNGALGLFLGWVVLRFGLECVSSDLPSRT